MLTGEFGLQGPMILLSVSIDTKMYAIPIFIPSIHTVFGVFVSSLAFVTLTLATLYHKIY